MQQLSLTRSRQHWTLIQIASAQACTTWFTDYVAGVVHIWKHHDLAPVRSRASKFHRFVDLVLIAAFEPWSKRHAVSFNDLLAEQLEFHRNLPEDIRRLIRAAPRQSDTEWLVTDDHVKKAIRLNSKKHAQNT